VDVVIMNEHTIDLKPERAIPAVEIDISVALWGWRWYVCFWFAVSFWLGNRRI